MEGFVEASVGQEPKQVDDTQHAWSGCEHHEMLAKDGGDVGGCFHVQPERQQKISLIKGEDGKFEHDLGEALRDATRKDLRDDGIHVGCVVSWPQLRQGNGGEGWCVQDEG